MKTMFRPTSLALALFLAAGPRAAVGRRATRPAAFTLEQVLSAPFPSDLVAAPSGGAWPGSSTQKGARNVWVAAAPDYRGHAVTAYPDDDGQEISEVAFTPDGKSVAYVRGGPPNRASESRTR